jgi:hypothetical protein
MVAPASAREAGGVGIGPVAGLPIVKFAYQWVMA